MLDGFDSGFDSKVTIVQVLCDPRKSEGHGLLTMDVPELWGFWLKRWHTEKQP